ncbi:hypothetical protein GKZ90_0019490 [Flavobacterium sp. MC2016-06]|jgi:hypothetical protein|uniref:hypothetical protein n=1 Tax=Flavobacterium sp. MC2016-06 TaxID=2676308 RepID=UPI0012BA58E3|nr:hypothetical protein [Flavobacterium sp. MC2016-06]MBU3862154.1 hypothetical protein [Flavobacterium sp. MC2016-06]
MREVSKLIFLLIGNLCRWISYGGSKSMDEVLKEDNELLGFIVAAIVFFFVFYFIKL